jgi:hypothetical protein
LVNKGERADISKADKNAMRQRLSRFADTYRAGIRQKLKK